MSYAKKIQVKNKKIAALKPVKNQAQDTAFKAAKLADEKKAIDIEVLDISNFADIADFVVICSGDNPAQLKAIAAHVEDSLARTGVEPNHKEGKYGDKWFLLDYIDFIVHIIDEDARVFYNLEELWSGAIFIPEHDWVG